MNESAKKYCENCLSKQIIIHAETINKIIEQCLIEFPSTNTQQLKEYLHQYCQEKAFRNSRANIGEKSSATDEEINIALIATPTITFFALISFTFFDLLYFYLYFIKYFISSQSVS